MVGVDIDITERRQAGETLRRLEKLSVLERMATSIAHEINNPLMALSNELFLINQSTTLEDAKRYARLAQEEVTRITYYSTRILRLRRNASPLHTQKMREIIEALLTMLEHRYPNVKVQTDFRENGHLEASREDVEQLFGIILANAFEAVATGGIVKVRVVERVVTGRRGVRVMVGDNGKGMSAEVKARLFEPFFSTKTMTGLGLGLWIASKIVQDTQGRIKIRSSDGPVNHGTIVSVFLPFRAEVL